MHLEIFMKVTGLIINETEKVSCIGKLLKKNIQVIGMMDFKADLELIFGLKVLEKISY